MTVKEYNIKRLLLDFTRNTLDLTETEYKYAIAQFAVGLMQTSLEKIARIGTKNHMREQKIISKYEGIKNAVALSIAFEIFSDQATALKWLLEK